MSNVDYPGERDDSPAFRGSALPREAGAFVTMLITDRALFKAVSEEINAHCNSIRGFAATLPEFEARLIAGNVVRRLLMNSGDP
jgi:hypothetical protein